MLKAILRWMRDIGRRAESVLAEYETGQFIECHHVAGSKIVLIQITVRSSYEAAVRSEEIMTGLKTGKAVLHLSVGEIVESMGPPGPEPWSPKRPLKPL